MLKKVLVYEVHKFGGASIGSLERIKNTIEIIKSFRSDSKIIIFSAMGKVTNMLEEIIISSYKGEIYFNQFEKLKNYHYSLIEKFYLQECDLFSEIGLLFEELKKTLKNQGVSMICLGRKVKTACQCGCLEVWSWS